MIAARRLLAPLILVCVLGSLALAASASAATIFVSTPTDEDALDNGACSLREAIASADSDTAIGGCSAGSGTDTVSTPNAPGQINLDPDFGRLIIGSDLTIVAPSGALVIHGSGVGGVLEVAADTTVTIFGVRIENGAIPGEEFTGGAGIFNEGDLTLIGVNVADNSISTSTASPPGSAAASGAGIFNTNGTLTLIRSTVTDNTAEAFDGDTPGVGATVRGAGITSFGPLNISKSTVSGNVATALDESGGDPDDAAEVEGGGIFAFSDLTVDHSTISGNSATATSAGGLARALGGAVYVNQGGEIELSTIADNTVSAASGASFSPRGGGIFNTGNPLFIWGSTITGNGGTTGGVFGANIDDAAPGTSLTSTIVSDPLGGANSCRVTVDSGGFNIDSGTSCGLGETTDQDDTDPMLDPAGLIQDGSATETIRPLPGSPAIDQGTTGIQTDATHDQRGLERPVNVPVGEDAGDSSDVGAYEAQAPATPTFASTDPASPSNDVTPRVLGSAPGADTVTLFVNADCSTTVGGGTAAAFSSPGVQGGVSTNSLTTFYGMALNAYGIYSPCSSDLVENGSIAYMHDSIAPQTTISSYVLQPTPKFYFSATDADLFPRFECSIDTGTPSYFDCGSPYTPPEIQRGAYTFRVRGIDAAGNADLSPATQPFTVVPDAVIPNQPPAKKCKKGRKLKKGKCVKKKKKKKH